MGTEFEEKTREYFEKCNGVKFGVFWESRCGCSSRLESFRGIPLGYFDSIGHAMIAAEICERVLLSDRGQVWDPAMAFDSRLRKFTSEPCYQPLTVPSLEETEAILRG